MNDDQIIETLRQIKLGIDAARRQGIVCGYPAGASVGGRWVIWPWREEMEGDLTGKESY